MKIWLKRKWIAARNRYLVEKFQQRKLEKHTLYLIRSSFKKATGWFHRPSFLTWSLTKRAWGVIRSFDSYVWPKVKKAGEAFTRMLVSNKFVATILANKFVIPIILGVAMLSAGVAWWLKRMITTLPTVPFHYWLWALGIGVGIALLILIVRKVKIGGATQPPTPPTPQTPPSTPPPTVIRHRGVGLWGLFWRGVGTVILVVVAIHYMVRELAPPSTTVTAASIPSAPTRLPENAVFPDIAQCESGGRQFDDQGNLVTNPKSSAIGKYGIMASLHEERAKSLGHDIRTLEGNEAYARVLYKENGLKDWEESRHCWEKRLLAKGLAVEAAKPTLIGEYTFNLTPEKPAVIRVQPWHRWDIVSPTVPPETGWPSWHEYRDSANNLVTTIETKAPAKELETVVRLRPCTSREDCARSQR